MCEDFVAEGAKFLKIVKQFIYNFKMSKYLTNGQLNGVQ